MVCTHSNSMSDILVCFYRISDCFQKTPTGGDFNKQRPHWFSKRRCFMNFLSVFGAKNLFVIADGVGQDTKKWLESKISSSQITYTNYRSGAFSFLHAARMAMQLPAQTKVYLVEDDYVATPDCKTCLIEGLNVSDYVTGYDALDKYVNGGMVNAIGCIGNPLITDCSEETRLYLTDSCHWKRTNSTTCTFASKAGIIKEDYPVYEQFCSGGFPLDFAMSRHLITQRNRKLISAVPAKTTHCESAYLAPLIDWQKCLETSEIQS